MSNTYIPPSISIDYDMDTDRFVLMASSHAHTAIVGPRIFRSEPWPEISFDHATKAEAERDAGILRDYLAACATGKQREAAPVGRGWWE